MCVPVCILSHTILPGRLKSKQTKNTKKEKSKTEEQKFESMCVWIQSHYLLHHIKLGK